MNEDRNFLSRWSRKKREAEELPQATAPAAKDAKPKESAAVAAPSGNTKAPRTEADEPKFDLASLPSIESIGADTDIRQFLRAGVPAELTRAALRRAWASDPAIRDYIGLSENSWNFNEPGAMYGFDNSDPGVDVKRLAEEMFGTKGEPGEKKSAEVAPLSIGEQPAEPPKALERPEPVAGPSDHDVLNSRADSVTADPDRAAEQGLLAPQKEVPAALQHDREQDAGPNPVRKRHGRALPS
jgi:hypothetical protein